MTNTDKEIKKHKRDILHHILPISLTVVLFFNGIDVLWVNTIFKVFAVAFFIIYAFCIWLAIDEIIYLKKHRQLD